MFYEVMLRKLGHLSLYIKINSKWIKDLNVKNKTINPLQKPKAVNPLISVLAIYLFSDSLFRIGHQRQNKHWDCIKPTILHSEENHRQKETAAH